MSQIETQTEYAVLSKPLVSVCCLTYNHEHTIAQTIESIVSQKADFPFELIIHDDASTDKTADIIREYAEKYPNIIRPILQSENYYHRCNLAQTFLNPMIRGRYVAICEGDDYWTDSDKLALQVERMERTQNCSMCFHAVDQLNADGTVMTYRPLKEDCIVPTELIIKRGGMFCPSVSLMLRRDVMDCWPEFREKADVYDYPTQVLAATMGEVCYIDRVMGVYRFASEGSWTAERNETTDYPHLENETEWLSLFNEYTDRRYQTAVHYHMAHLWFTEYRKNIDPAMKKKVKEYAASLGVRDRLIFSTLLLMFGLLGRRANKLWHLLKKYLLK